MLERIDLLQEVGRFAELKQNAPSFDRLTLIYARNGYGKSTVCAVLRSATTNDPDTLHVRRRVQAKLDTIVNSKWSGSHNVRFSGGSWNSNPSYVHVYDQDYIHKNIYTGESVTRDNKRSLLPVVMGAQGVVLAQEISLLDTEQRELAADIKRYSQLLRTKYAILSDGNINDFCRESVPENIDWKIQQSSRQLELARRASEVRSRIDLPTLGLPSKEQVGSILGTQLDGVASDAKALVERHFEKHGLGPNGKRWIDYGRQHNEMPESCPFCDQEVKGISLVEAYSAYFSEGFSALVNDCNQLLQTLRDWEEKLQSNDFWSGLEREIEFWQKVSSVNFPEVTEDEKNEINAGLGELRRLVQMKAQNPLSQVEFDGANIKVERLFRLVNELAEATSAAQTIINEARISVSNVALEVAQYTLDYWKALSEKTNDDVKKIVDGWIAASDQQPKTEAAKKAKQEELREYAASKIGTRQAEINKLLEEFGANFKVVDAKANFKGREPNAEFAIEIASHKILAGEKKTNTPSFDTVLSSGDKSTLALAFFITQVRSSVDIAKSVVVFDDPFNSQDMVRQFETGRKIREIAELAEQVVVLSHDPRFLAMIEQVDYTPKSTFQILCDLDGRGSIAKWSSSETLKSDYIKSSEIIREYSRGQKLLPGETEMSVKRAIRPFLEDYLKAIFPGRFAPGVMLKEMVDQIVASGPSDPLFRATNDLHSLNEYTRVSMHGGADRPDRDQLRAQCQKVDRLIGGY